MGDIERHHGDLDARFEDNRSSMWINIDVEFCRWRDVATFKIAAAHQNDFLDALSDLRLADQRRCDICQRAKRAERNGASFFLHQRFNNEINAMLRLKRHSWLWQIIAI